MTQYYSEMDAGEQRQWLAQRTAFGQLGSGEFHRKVVVLAKRISSTTKQVEKDILKDAELIRMLSGFPTLYAKI